jgi:hypothetical protein
VADEAPALEGACEGGWLVGEVRWVGWLRENSKRVLVRLRWGRGRGFGIQLIGLSVAAGCGAGSDASLGSRLPRGHAGAALEAMTTPSPVV